MALLLVSGCGKKEVRKPVYPVTGRVTSASKSADGALVVLHPVDDDAIANWPTGYPRGKVGPDGTFTIGTYEEADGAPVGNYKVVIDWRDMPDPSSEERGPDKLKERYTARNTPLKAQVAEGPNTIGPFEVSTK
jgi:hypothetical protein